MSKIQDLWIKFLEFLFFENPFYCFVISLWSKRKQTEIWKLVNCYLKDSIFMYENMKIRHYPVNDLIFKN